MNYYNEFDPKAAAWLRELIKEGHIPDGWVDERSITDVRPHEVARFTQQHFFAGIGGWSLALRLAGWPDDKPVRTGSCPCQPFSQAGKGLGEKDDRHLWPVFRDLITFGEPTVTFGEQVASPAGRDWLSDVRSDLEGLGYEVGAADLCSAGIGRSHGRARLYWVASNPASVRRARLEPTRDLGPTRQGRTCSQEDLQAIIRSPFSPGGSWPQPLLRSVDDGLSTRMVGCHGAGNAIDPGLAAEFILAFLETQYPPL